MPEESVVGRIRMTRKQVAVVIEMCMILKNRNVVMMKLLTSMTMKNHVRIQLSLVV